MRYLLCLLALCSSLLAEPPKAIVFDFGGVVGKLHRKEIFQFLANSFGIPCAQVEIDFGREVLYVSLNKPQCFWEGYAGKKLPIGWGDQLREMKEKIIHPIRGMKELIIELKNLGFQVAILSNTELARSRFISSTGSYNLFDPILLSCDTGMRKPHLSTYKMLLNTLEIPPEDCVFVDDKMRNIEAAQKLGIQAIHFSSAKQLRKALQKLEIPL